MESDVFRRAGLVVLLVMAAGACATRGQGADLERMDRVPMVVENQNFYQATIYARLNSARVRLGEVPGNSTATFSAPSPPAGQISVEIRLLAVGAFTSHPITIAPGDTVRVTVPPNLHRYRGRPR
jgi:hypothetical protein